MVRKEPRIHDLQTYKTPKMDDLTRKKRKFRGNLFNIHPEFEILSLFRTPPNMKVQNSALFRIPLYETVPHYTNIKPYGNGKNLFLLNCWPLLTF